MSIIVKNVISLTKMCKRITLVFTPVFGFVPRLIILLMIMISCDQIDWWMLSLQDTDVMWLRNPFPMLSQNERIDLQISTDNFNGNEWSEDNPINTGFYFIRFNNKTMSLFDAWYAMKNNSVGIKEQDVLLNMMHEGVFKELGLTVRFLDTNYFSGFCKDSEDFKAVRTVHANCCRTISAKLTDLMAVIHDWERYKRASTNESLSTAWSSHVACSDSWKS